MCIQSVKYQAILELVKNCKSLLKDGRCVDPIVLKRMVEYGLRKKNIPMFDYDYDELLNYLISVEVLKDIYPKGSKKHIINKSGVCVLKKGSNYDFLTEVMSDLNLSKEASESEQKYGELNHTLHSNLAVTKEVGEIIAEMEYLVWAE